MKRIKTFFSHLLVAIGAIAACIGAFSWLIGYSIIIQIICGLGVLLVGGVYAFFQMYPSKSIQIRINDALPLQIEFGDIFEKKGVVIIAFNDCFDTIVDDKVIATATIHGMFINRLFKERVSDLDRKIEEALSGVQPEDIPNRIHGKKKRYPLGTCAVIKDEESNNTYILAALTKFDANNHASIPLSEYGTIIQKIIMTANREANYRPVYMPLLGSGQGGIQKSAQKILFYMICQIEFCPNISIPKGLHIIVHESANMSINLDDVKSAWLSTIK
nr:macro domain-containing protein [uncultured Porphyromonas sp.]